MRMLQNARTAAFAATLSLVAAACGGDDKTGPGEFNPAGTSQDITAVQGAFQSDAFVSFVGMGEYMGAALGSPLTSPAVLRDGFQASVSASNGFARGEARRLAELLAPSARGAATSARIPEAYQGKTFEYDFVEERYLPGERTGAPANGVRFIMYAVNPANGDLTETEVGYVDLIDNSTQAQYAAQVIVVSDGVTYLDYSVTSSTASTGGDLGIEGYVTDGDTRADFALTLEETDDTFSLDYTLTVDDRNLVVELSYTGNDATDAEVLDVHIAGENGTLDIAGTITGTGSALDVQIDGEDFATMTWNGDGDYTIVGADGEPLSNDEEQVLVQALGMLGGSIVIPFVLLAPALGLFAGA